jgi:hypothetical protein
VGMVTLVFSSSVRPSTEYVMSEILSMAAA